MMQEGLLKKWGLSEVVKVVSANIGEDAVEVIHRTWPVQASLSVFVTPSDQDTVTRLAESGWNTVYAGLYFRVHVQFHEMEVNIVLVHS